MKHLIVLLTLRQELGLFCAQRSLSPLFTICTVWGRVFVSPAKHSGTKGSLCPASVCMSVCLSVCACMRLSGRHTLLIVTHSYVLQATHACYHATMLQMLQLCLSLRSRCLIYVIQIAWSRFTSDFVLKVSSYKIYEAVNNFAHLKAGVGFVFRTKKFVPFIHHLHCMREDFEGEGGG